MEPFPEAYHGETAAALVACYNGDVDDGREALDSIETFGEPIVAFVDSMPYTALQQSFDDANPDGERYYAKSAFIEELSDDLIDDLAAITNPLPGPLSSVFFEQMGGTIDRVDRHATAFPHRGAPFNLAVQCGWSEPANDDEIIEWAREFHETIVPYSTGGVYVNYLDHDDDDRVTAAYRENYDRLRDVKAEWDPHNLFSTNQNVEPNGGAR
jgi:FAD/FMN-containing dehydrogenase